MKKFQHFGTPTILFCFVFIWFLTLFECSANQFQVQFIECALLYVLFFLLLRFVVDNCICSIFFTWYVYTLNICLNCWYISFFLCGSAALVVCWCYYQSIQNTNSALQFNFNRFYTNEFAFFFSRYYLNKRALLHTQVHSQLFWVRKKIQSNLLNLSITKSKYPRSI